MRAICEQLRRLVAEVAPEAHEIAYLRHNTLAYSLSGAMRERVLYICPLQEWVRMGFDYGANLPDPAHLVEGDGKRMPM